MSVSSFLFRLSAAARRLLLSLLGLLLMTVAGPAVAEWPQWRGPSGLGVSTDPAPLPETWEPDSPNIRWRTAIPGEGISSPIASQGRVFVTTASEGARSQLLRALFRGTTIGLALVALLLVLRRRKPKPGPRSAARWDRRIVMSSSIAFLALAIALAVDPGIFFEVGNPGRAWRAGGGIALLGLAAAFGWFARGSGRRLLGAGIVLLGAYLLLSLMPAGPLGSDRLSKGLPFVTLGGVVALWYILGFPRGRRDDSTVVGNSSSLIALSLLVLAGLVFVPHNFLTGLQRAVVALDLETGEILWERPVLRGPQEQKWPNSSYATPTPATDGQHVFSYFGHGLASVDFDGRIAWSRKFPRYSQSTRYGAGASPVVVADSVIVVQEQEAHQDAPPSWIAAFDTSTGRPLWRIEPPGAHDSYNTPLALESASGAQLLTASWNALEAYDATSGERLWSFPYPMEQMVASMARAGNLLAVTGGAYGERALMVFRVDDESDTTKVEALWQDKRGVATIVSPVFYEGLLFTLTTPGIMTCYEAESGKVLWKKRLDGEYFASLVAGDGKIYATSSEGSTSVVAAEPEFRLIAVNNIGDRVFATPAISDGCLLIRTASSLSCIDAKAG